MIEAGKLINAQAAPSTIGAVPFYPNLKQAFNRIASCLVFTYLEIHHAVPRDTSGRTTSLPVTVDMETACRDLQVTRRTLSLALYPLSVIFKEEAQRFRAARGAREFLFPAAKRHGVHKLYSIVSGKTLDAVEFIVLRRNLPLLAQTLIKCGYPDLFNTPQAAICALDRPQNVSTDQDLAGASACVSPLSTSLAEILMRASVLSVDGRSRRYSRLRKAVESGLEDASVLKVKQPKGRKRNNQLTEKNEARLINLREDEKQGI